MIKPGRSYNSSDYRYGFNGMEKDDEIKGIEGSSHDFGARMLDVRLGRWFSTDPLERKYTNLSPYHVVGNSPIWIVDKDGRENTIYIYVSETARKSPEMKNVSDFFLKQAVQNNIYEVSGLTNINVQIVYNPVTPVELDASDAFVYIAGGTPEQAMNEINDFDNKFTKNDGDLIFFGGDDYFLIDGPGFGDRSTVNGIRDGARNLIGIDLERAVKYNSSSFSGSTINSLSFLITHGLGHNVIGDAHNDDTKGKQKGTFMDTPKNYEGTKYEYTTIGLNFKYNSSSEQKNDFSNYFGINIPKDNRASNYQKNETK